MSDKKEKFITYIKEHGYKSVRSLAIDAGIDTANLFTNLNSKWGLSIQRAFRIANTIGVPVEEILEIFYEEELAENRKAVESKEVPVETAV